MSELTHVIVAIDRIMRADYDCPVLVKISPRTTPVGIAEDVTELKLSIKKQLLLYGDRYKLTIHTEGRKIYITKKASNE